MKQPDVRVEADRILILSEPPVALCMSHALTLCADLLDAVDMLAARNAREIGVSAKQHEIVAR